MTPERQAEARRLLMPQQPRCRHARDGQDTCGPDVHNLHCSWPACAEPKVLSRDEHEQAMRTALTEALDALAALEAGIDAAESLARSMAKRANELVVNERRILLHACEVAKDMRAAHERAEKAEAQLTALEAEVARLKEAALDHECPSFGMCRQHATTAVPDSCLYCDLATLTAEHARLTARWEALRAWAQARYDETENLDDVASWAYERMMGRMNILERGDDHP